MAREQGIVRLVPNKRFFFLERPTQPGQATPPVVFAMLDWLPQGLTIHNGDTLEFETEPDPKGKGPRAKDITLISAVSAHTVNPVPASTTSPAPATPVAAAPAAYQPAVPNPEFCINFEFEEPETDADAWEMEVRVIVTKGGKPVHGALVQNLKFGPFIANDPAESINTDSNGQATYMVRYLAQPSSTLQVPKKILFAAEVSYQGQKATMSTSWPPKKTNQPALPATPASISASRALIPATATAVPPPAEDKPNRLVVEFGYANTQGWIPVTVRSFKDSVPCAGEFEISCGGMFFAVVNHGGQQIGAGAQVTHKTGTGACCSYFLQFAEEQAPVTHSIPGVYEPPADTLTKIMPKRQIHRRGNI